MKSGIGRSSWGRKGVVCFIIIGERLSPVTRCRRRAPKSGFEVERSLDFPLAAGSALICDDLLDYIS